VFVFDTTILAPLLQRKRDSNPDRRPADRRVEFILASLRKLDGALRQWGGGLIVLHGDSRHAIPRLAAMLGASAVYANRDYEPFEIERDAIVQARLREAGRELALQGPSDL
jgi:deoxyribodipyrimidine photo-lyase